MLHLVNGLCCNSICVKFVTKFMAVCYMHNTKLYFVVKTFSNECGLSLKSETLYFFYIYRVHKKVTDKSSVVLS